jgi:hypothetical protein
MSLLLPTQECKTVLALTLTSREASFKLPLARGVGSTTTAAEMGGTKVDAIHHPTSMELRRKKKGLRLVRKYNREPDVCGCDMHSLDRVELKWGRKADLLMPNGTGMFPCYQIQARALIVLSLSHGCGFPECMFGCVRESDPDGWLQRA